jgi:co-chaperonin GroES (HSP10)
MLVQPFSFIVSPLNNSQYVNTKDVNGKELIVNTSIEEASNVNRIGVVQSLPNNYKGVIRKGDQVVIQHNVFRIYLDGNGTPRQSDNHIKDDLFSVTQDLIYLIIRNGEKLASDDYIFAKEIIEEDKWLGKVVVENVGIATYINPTIKNQGIKVGDKIAFQKNSNYKFDIFGETLYLMRNKRVLAKIN